MVFGFFKKKKDKKQQNNHYLDLTVRQVIQETPDAISIVFETPESGLSYQSGQFLTLIADIDGKEIRRSYSFSSAPGIDKDISVTIKRVKDGLMSNYLADHIMEGSVMNVMEPLGRFTLDFNPDNKRHLVMFAGGSGITPMMSLIKTGLEKEPETNISLIYSNRNEASIIFKKQFDQLSQQYPDRLKVFHVLEEAAEDWVQLRGLLSLETFSKITREIPDIKAEDTLFMMCGPEGMMENVEKLLGMLGIPGEAIMKESFTSSAARDVDLASLPKDTKEVVIHYEGNRYVLQVEPGNSILETALDQNLDLPFSCQAGLCTACRGKLISGEVRLDEEEGLTKSEREAGYVLTCVGHPVTDNVEIRIG